MFGELAKEALGGVVQFGRHFDHEVDVEIAAAAPVQVLDALVRSR